MLSICIPTFNRAVLLDRCLTSIRKQVAPEVEVIVADNASTDHTRTVVEHHRKHSLKRLTYTRAPSNRGFDANLKRAVAAARGDMCWFVGDDDRLYPGAVSRVLDTMAAAPGAMIVGDVHTSTDDGKPVKIEPSTAWPDYSVFRFDEPGTVARYLSRARSVRAAFPFIANIVFPRSAWPRDMKKWNGTAYSHLSAWWQMALDGVPVVTRRKILVWAGIGRPERRDANTLAYVRLDMDTIARVCRLFPDAKDRAALRRVWNFEYHTERRRSLEARCKRQPSWLFVRDQMDRTLRGGTD